MGSKSKRPLIDLTVETDGIGARRCLKENERWFEENFWKLRKKYVGKLIAICKRKVIAVADTIEELERKIEEGPFDPNEVVKQYIDPLPPPEIQYMGPPRIKREGDLF